MTDNADEFFTPKHKRLARIASMANIFAWVILIFYIMQILLQVYQLVQSQGFQETVDMFLRQPGSILNLYQLLRYLFILLQGLVYWIILKGVSVGLSMILETDLNYKEKYQGE